MTRPSGSECDTRHSTFQEGASREKKEREFMKLREEVVGGQNINLMHYGRYRIAIKLQRKTRDLSFFLALPIFKKTQ